MKIKKVIQLLEQRSKLVDRGKIGLIEIRAIDIMLKDEKIVPSKIYVKSFVGTLEKFCKEVEECNLVEVKFQQDIRETYIVAKGQSFKVHSNYPTEKFVDISFMWKKGVNNQMRYLMKKYPILREYMWKAIKKEIDYIRKNKLKEELLSL